MHIKGRVSEINREPRELGFVLFGYGRRGWREQRN